MAGRKQRGRGRGEWVEGIVGRTCGRSLRREVGGVRLGGGDEGEIGGETGGDDGCGFDAEDGRAEGGGGEPRRGHGELFFRGPAAFGADEDVGG